MAHHLLFTGANVGIEMNHHASVRRMTLWSLGLGLVTLPACGHGDMDMMSNHSAVFDEHLGAYQAELESHRTAIEGASDLAQVAAFETHHVSGTQPHMSTMRHELGDMIGCMGPAGEQPNGEQVLGDLDRLQRAHDDHRTAMTGATDMASAHAEEIRHQGQMAGIMGDMQTHAGAMMNGNGHYNCPHHSR